MSSNKHIDKICCVILAVSLILTVVFMNADQFGVQPVIAAAGYSSRLFNPSTVHSIDIVMDDWDSFIENCSDEEYADCTLIIDGEAYRNTAIRAKGNTSLTSVAAYGNNRYSFKVEFDHYDSGASYYGLDKLCLNNIIQDNTYMKDYLTYRMMLEFDADAPLCSYTQVTVNGKDWGLYLAVEGVEEAFLQRSYGSDYGQLYKPDSMNMGGGRGNGRNFDMEEFDFESISGNNASVHKDKNKHFEAQKTENNEGRMGNKMGSSDVSLIYTDDEIDSYTNIFENAKTNPTDSDKARLIASLKKLNNGEDMESVVNIDEVIRYFVVHNFVLNFDSYTGGLIHNYYLYEKDGQLSMIPWDYNLAFGGFESHSDATTLVNYPIDTPVSGQTVDSRPMLAWIFNNQEYTHLYHEYFAAFLAKYFEDGYLENMIDSVEEMIAPYVENDPTKFCTYEEFKEGVSVLKEFCLLRTESINGQLDGSIPSTSDGQKQNKTSLIDASGLTVSATGSMEKTMGRNDDFGGGPAPLSGQQDAVEAFHQSDGQDNTAQASAPPDRPDDTAQAFAPFGGQDDTTQAFAPSDKPDDTAQAFAPSDSPDDTTQTGVPPDRQDNTTQAFAPSDEQDDTNQAFAPPDEPFNTDTSLNSSDGQNNITNAPNPADGQNNTADAPNPADGRQNIGQTPNPSDMQNNAADGTLSPNTENITQNMHGNMTDRFPTSGGQEQTLQNMKTSLFLLILSIGILFLGTCIVVIYQKRKRLPHHKH